MDNLLPVEGNPGLYRDIHSRAIIDCSDTNYDNYLQLKKRKILEVNEMNKLKDEVNQIETIKNEVAELKDMMKLILSKLDTNS
jgi:esterase/lipase